MEENKGKLKLLSKIDKFYATLLPVLRKFPKTQRYTMAINIENELLSCVRLVYFIAYQKYQRAENLKALRIQLHLLNFLIRASHGQNFISDAGYELYAKEVSELGKITSQWLKTVEKK